MLKLLCKLFANKDKRKNKFLPYEQFVVELRKSGIKTFEEYHNNYKDHPGWPSTPMATYKIQLKRKVLWNELISVIGEKLLPYEQFVVELRNSGIKTRDEYTAKYKDHPGWLSDPWRVYGKSWNKMIGKGNILPYEQFVIELHDSKIKTEKEYGIAYIDHLGWPSNPTKYYTKQLKRNINWTELIGKEKTDFLPYEQFVVELRNSGIKKFKEYKTKYKDHPDWPSTPWKIYNNSWMELIGKEKIDFLPYEQFIAELRNSGIKKYKHEYFNKYKNHPSWTSDPMRIYGKSWKVLIGKTPDPEQLKDKGLADIVDMLGGE